MAEYIERETAKDELLSWAVCINHPEHLTRDDAMHVLDSIPAADVAPVVHGRWERVIPSKNAAKWSNKVGCSVCHREGYTRYNYCPNCGAKMDLEENNGET